MNSYEFKQKVLKGISNQSEFDGLAMDLFRFQAEQNKVYKDYLKNLGVDLAAIKTISDIPYLPIEAFKYHLLHCDDTLKPSLVFESSGTGKGLRSKHQVYDLEFYLMNTKRIFETSYGPLNEISVLAYLPSYHEQKSSSLLYMVQDFIKQASLVGSGFYIDRQDELVAQLMLNQQAGIKTLLIGVSYALLDLAEATTMDLSNIIVMETGGMKGRRKELNRNELHEILKSKFNLAQIHSEYGMTELMSQAYSKGAGLFNIPSSMQLCFKELTDPFTTVRKGKIGTINIIDLANVDSCAFIATQDLGRDMGDHTFKVEGRLDYADIRGCSLLYTG